MSLFRLVMEDDNSKEKYKYLNLYCNWTLHTEISGSSTAYEILEYIAESIRNYEKNPSTALWLNDAVVLGLSTHKLNSDILNVCQEYNLTEANKFRDIKEWVKFGRLLIDILSNKQLRFPNPINSKKVQAIYDSIMTKASMPELLKYCQVVGLEFKDSLYSKPHCEEFGIDVSHLEIITMETIERGIHIICEVNFITENQINP